MKLLLLGADGMLGHVVKIYFDENGHDVKTTSRHSDGDYQLDITKNLSDVQNYIQEFHPEAVVNCIGILNKEAEDHHSLAVLVNSYLPHYLDEICTKNGAKLIHISTDCVFDGKKGDYTEESFRTATDFYGRSKGLGEVENNSSLNLRTSIVGPDIKPKGIGLFQWFMNQEDEVSGFDKVIWTGVTTVELARCIEKALINNLTGLRHVVNNQKINKYDLLNLFKEYFNKKITISRKSDYVSDKSLVRTTDFDFEIPSYAQMVKEMADWVTKHESIYSESQRVKK